MIKTTDGRNQQTDNNSQEQARKDRAGGEHESSHDHMAREQASTGEGAGGGAKQKQDH
jgi:hypothetical protein